MKRNEPRKRYYNKKRYGFADWTSDEDEPASKNGRGQAGHVHGLVGPHDEAVWHCGDVSEDRVDERNQNVVRDHAYVRRGHLKVFRRAHDHEFDLPVPQIDRPKCAERFSMPTLNAPHVRLY